MRIKTKVVIRKIDRENGSTDNSLQCIVVEGSGKGSIELQDICDVKHVGVILLKLSCRFKLVQDYV